MSKRGNTKDKIDRDLLHDYLFQKSDRHNMITISPTELAEELGITVYSMSRILSEMRKAGRLRKVGTRTEVVDPGLYVWSNPQST